MPFLRPDEIRELQGIAYEEHRGVVADEIPVAFLGVELHGEAAHVAFGIRGAEFTRHRGEASQQRRLLADLREDRGPGVLRDVRESP